MLALPVIFATTGDDTPPSVPPSSVPPPPAAAPPPLPPSPLAAEPVVTAPVFTLPPATAAPPAKRSSAGLAIGIGAAGCLLLVVLGVGGWFLWSRLKAPRPAEPPPVATSAATTPAAGDATPAANDATPAADDATPAASDTGTSPGVPDLGRYAGKWEFVGQPGPWGEGAPFVLERAGDSLTGTAGLPDWEEKTQLTLSAEHGGVKGQSTTTDADGHKTTMALSLELDEGGDIMTVQYQAADGQWLTRVAKRTGTASEGGGPATDARGAD